MLTYLPIHSSLCVLIYPRPPHPRTVLLLPDPHGGNLLNTGGKLAYLDFGMMTQVRQRQTKEGIDNYRIGMPS